MDTHEIKNEILKELYIFRELSIEDIIHIEELLNFEKVIEGEILTQKDDPAWKLFIIHSGNFMVYFEDGQAYTLHNKSEIIGFEEALSSSDLNYSVVALTDGDVLYIKFHEFQKLLKNNPDLNCKLKKNIKLKPVDLP